MVMSIYLHKYIIDILKLFGNLDEVVNNVLEYCDNRDGLTDYPKCPERQGAGRYNIDIVYAPYLEVYNKFGPTSPRSSVRKILYNFVDNELYTEGAWLKYNYKNNKMTDYQYVYRKCEDVYIILNKIYNKLALSDHDTRIIITKMMTDILNLKCKLLKEDVNDEGEKPIR